MTLMDPGGRQEPRLTSMENAAKELFEETFCTLSVPKLNEERSVLVHGEYRCYPLYVQVDDFTFFKDILEMNKKLIHGSNDRRLHCFQECRGFEFVPVKDILSNTKGKVEIHKRALGAIKEFCHSQTIVDGRVKIEVQKLQLDRLNYPNQRDMLRMMHKQYTYITK